MKIKRLSLVEEVNRDIESIPVSNEYKIVPGLSKLKEMNNNYLLFSPFLHKLYILPKDLYNHLISGKEYFENKEELINSHILVPKDYDFYPPSKDYSRMNVFTISLTTECNLRCIYCFTRGGESSIRIKNFDYIKNIIDYAINRNRDRKIGINLLSSGEPTLAFDLIKKISEYLNNAELENGSEINLVTNGTFPPKVADWIKDNINYLTITMDGPPEIHDRQRPFKSGSGSSKIVEKNIKFFVENDKKFSVNSIITDYSVERQTDILNYFHSIGVKELTFVPLSLHGRCLDSCSVFTHLGLSKYIENWLKARELAEEYSVKLNSNLLSIGKIRSRSCGYLGFHADGCISLCSGVNEISKNK